MMQSISRRVGRRWQVAAATAVLVVFTGAFLASGPSAQSVSAQTSNAAAPRIQGPVSFADVIAAVSPAVVNISVQKVTRTNFSGNRESRGQLPEGVPFNEFFGRFFNGPQGGMPERRSQALGSGFIVSADGYIVTNNHVIADSDVVTVLLEDGSELEANVIGVDERTDLAVLKVTHDASLPFVEFGDSDAARVGEWVLAIGNPFGLGGSATAGIISARGRDIRSGPYDDYLQIDAPINSGNSGGPVFNGAGQVIGVNTAIISPNGGNIGIGLAIPAMQARPIIDSLIADGSVSRGWLGVQIQDLDPDLAAALGVEDGALVADVDATGPAAAAGLEAGDVIRSVAGRDIENSRELSRVIAANNPGRALDIGVLRDGREREFSVTLGDLDRGLTAATRSNGAGGRSDGLQQESFGGLRIEPLRPERRSSLGLPDNIDGVLVTGVEPGSAAAQKGIRPGDVITGIDRRAIDGVGDARTALDSARSGSGRALLVLRRGDSQRYVALPLS